MKDNFAKSKRMIRRLEAGERVNRGSRGRVRCERLKIVRGRLRAVPAGYLSTGIVNASRGMPSETRDHRSH